MLLILIVVFYFPAVGSLTFAELMGVIRENDLHRKNTPQWTRELEDKLPPVGYVAGEPIRSRFWDNVNPNEHVYFDENGIPYQLPWRFSGQRLNVPNRP